MLPRIIASLGGALIVVTGSIVARVLTVLGISAVTYKGISTTLDWFKDRMLDALDGIPEKIVSLLAYMNVGTCINIIMTAIMLRLVIKGMTGGSLTRWVLKK